MVCVISARANETPEGPALSARGPAGGSHTVRQHHCQEKQPDRRKVDSRAQGLSVPSPERQESEPVPQERTSGKPSPDPHFAPHLSTVSKAKGYPTAPVAALVQVDTLPRTSTRPPPQS